jgi:hypothetical protein
MTVYSQLHNRIKTYRNVCHEIDVIFKRVYVVPTKFEGLKKFKKDDIFAFIFSLFLRFFLLLG